MKKINILLAGLIAVGFASCDDTSDLGITQINPQLPQVDVNNLTVSLDSSLASGVNLNTNTSGVVPVLTIDTPVDSLPEGATTEFVMELASNQDYSNAVDLAVSNGAVSAADWETAFVGFYGVDPSEQTMYIRFAAYIEQDGQMSRIGDLDKYYLASDVLVTPVDAELDVESTYYLVYGDTKVEFNHSDKHVYVDPIFSVVVEFDSAELPIEWTVESESGRIYGATTTDISNACTGELEEDGNGVTIDAAGAYQFTVNMLDLTFTVKDALEYLYTPGAQGWNFDNNMLLINSGDYSIYWGYVYVSGTEFKLTGQADWSPLDWGATSTTPATSGDLKAQGSNITVEQSGLYWVVANIDDLKYQVTLIETIGVIGDATPGGWDASTPLTPNSDYTVWTGDVTLGDGEWKFRANDNWDVNLGGSETDLVQNGGNLASPGAGTYTVELKLATLPYTCTVTAK